MRYRESRVVLVLAAGFGLVGPAAPTMGDGPLFLGAKYDAFGGPRSVAIGDLDADQVPDLAVAGYGASVSVLRGLGDRTFGAAVNYDVGDHPEFIAIGDLNGDQVPDLVVANSGTYPDVGNVSVLLGVGDGTFAAAMHYAAGNSPRSVAIGDLDGDQVPDLTVANYYTDDVSVLLGCPVARDMDGKALSQIADAEEPPDVEMIDTYEATSDEMRDTSDLPNPISDIQEDPWVAQQMLDRLVDLGYIEQDESVEGVVLDRARNLGQVYAATGRPAKAIQQYEEVLAKKPDDKGCKMAIASCRLEMGQLGECESAVKDVLSDKADAPQANLYLGIISFRRGDTIAALEHLKEAEKADPRMPGLHCQIGTVYLRRQRWQDAKRAFKKALDIDPDSAEAHDGLGVAYRWQKRPAEAVHEHMQSIGLLHYRPQTHIHLGLALAETGQIDWAIRAFNVAIEQNPNNPFPHRCLAQLYERASKNPVKAEQHRNLAGALAEQLKGNPGGESAPSQENS